MADDLTVKILQQIRDEVRNTNARLDGTNARLDETNARLTRIEVDHGAAIHAILGTLEHVANRLWSGGGLEHRVEKCEREIEDLKRR